MNNSDITQPQRHLLFEIYLHYKSSEVGYFYDNKDSVHRIQTVNALEQKGFITREKSEIYKGGEFFDLYVEEVYKNTALYRVINAETKEVVFDFATIDEIKQKGYPSYSNQKFEIKLLIF